MARMMYWAVKYKIQGDIKEDHLRITSQKTDNAITAAKMCFGVASDNQLAKPLTSRVADLRGLTKRMQALMNPEGWEQVLPNGSMSR